MNDMSTPYISPVVPAFGAYVRVCTTTYAADGDGGRDDCGDWGSWRDDDGDDDGVVCQQ